MVYRKYIFFFQISKHKIQKIVFFRKIVRFITLFEKYPS